MRLGYNILLAVLSALFIIGCSQDSKTELYQEIKSVDKMVFATMAITKTAKKDRSGLFGNRIAVYSYDSYMRAYIDLSALQIDDLIFNDKNMTVKVILPPVVTEITGRDMEMRKIYDNIGWLRDSLDSKERAEIKEEANISFKEEVEDNPMFKEQLTEAAKRKARKYFEAIFEANGYTPSIEFQTIKSESHD